MTFRPQRKKRERSGIRDGDGPVRCQSHLQHVGGLICCIAGKHSCSPGRSHAHHVQSYRAIEGGMGMKVGDDKVVPLCSTAHALVHDKGQAWFEKTFGIELEEIALGTWKHSPHRRAFEQKRANIYMAG